MKEINWRYFAQDKRNFIDVSISYLTSAVRLLLKPTVSQFLLDENNVVPVVVAVSVIAKKGTNSQRLRP